jgi:transmembrane sensor
MFDDQELMQRISSAGASIDPGLSDRDVDRLVAGAARRRWRRRLRRMALTGATAVSLALASLVLLHRGASRSQSGVVASQPQPPVPAPNRLAAERVLADGSTASALDPAAKITVTQDTKDRAEVVLAHGRGRFDVRPRPARSFVVRAGEVTVTVLGTLFTVERVADRVGISVEQGTVRVEWGVGSAILNEGESGWYPPLVVRTLESSATSPAKTSRATTRPVGRSPSLASSQESPSTPGPAKIEKAESAEQLLSAADNARLSGQAEQGAHFLRRLLREHRDDARAPLAAFTLGRMLLMELANPIEAAGAFAESRRLSPHGPLAEAALAREVEALDQAGVSALAKDRAREYLRLYPDGRRAAAVQRMAGIR